MDITDKPHAEMLICCMHFVELVKFASRTMQFGYG